MTGDVKKLAIGHREFPTRRWLGRTFCEFVPKLHVHNEPKNRGIRQRPLGSIPAISLSIATTLVVALDQPFVSRVPGPNDTSLQVQL